MVVVGLIAAAGGGLIARIAARRVQRWVHRLLGVTVSALWRMVVVGGHAGWSAAGVTDPVSAGLSQAATAATGMVWRWQYFGTEGTCGDWCWWWGFRLARVLSRWCGGVTETRSGSSSGGDRCSVGRAQSGSVGLPLQFWAGVLQG